MCERFFPRANQESWSIAPVGRRSRPSGGRQHHNPASVQFLVSKFHSYIFLEAFSRRATASDGKDSDVTCEVLRRVFRVTNPPWQNQSSRTRRAEPASADRSTARRCWKTECRKIACVTDRRLRPRRQTIGRVTFEGKNWERVENSGFESQSPRFRRA